MSSKEAADAAKASAQADKTATGDGKDQDVLYVQDAGFNVKVSVPGIESITIQVSSMELVQEIHQLLMDREDTCHRTCFSLQLDGVPLDNFAELKSIEGLKEGSVLKVVEEPYTVREARIHIRHLRDLLKSTDFSDAYNGVECASLAFLHTVCQGDVLTTPAAVDGKRAGSRGGRSAAAAAAAASAAEGIDCTPPEDILPDADSDSRPLLPLHPISSANASSARLNCVRVVTTSAWNPPPGPRRLHGDLLYVQVVTLEDKRFHITASTRGFYVNQSTEQIFNPTAVAPIITCHSLIDLLTQLSPAFKKNFNQLQKRRTGRHPFERVATPYQVYSWLSPKQEHTLDAIRAEDAFSSKLGYEEHIPGQTRDWNEELQTTRELPRKSLPERLLRERAIFKVHSDFVSAATRGAMAVIDGNVMAINPGEEAKMQMFIWNNIFFSLGFDVRDHYKELGGDSAAFVAPRNDLQGVKVYNAVDLEGLYTLGTVVLDYRGFRVTAQSIIPGILEREQEQSVVYGSIDFGKTVVSHPKYMELLQKAGSQLKILPHSVVNDKQQEILLCSSVECKGIIGNDGRHYILDLLRTFPPDVNFLELSEDDVPLSREAKALGFPIVHNHKLSCLRQELVDAFVESRYMMFIKYAAVQLQQLGIKKQMDMLATTKAQEGNANLKKLESDAEPKSKDAAANSNTVSKKNVTDDEEAKKIVESITDSITSGDKRDIEESTKDIVKKAAQAVGSLKENEFDIRFNPDVFSPGVKHVESDAAKEELKKQCALTRDASDFLLTVQIPAFIRDCLDHSSVPMDGQTLSDNLHNRGINIRYIGVLSNMLAKVTQLKYIHTISVSEILLRSAKHVFTSYLQSLDLTCLSSAVSHFLNALFSSPIMAVNEDLNQLRVSKKKGGGRNRNKKGGNSGGNTNPNGGLLLLDGLDWASLTSRSLWKLLQDEAKSYYNYTLPAASMEEFCSSMGAQRISLLRSFAHKVGLQLQLREYHWDSKHSPIFSDDDVINMYPRAKHINPRASDAYNFYTTGQSKIQQGYLKDGYELISEALNLLNNVYGAMHPEIAQCLRMLARLNYIMGDHGEALSYQQKAVLMSERVNGIDHPYTITEYVHMALYCFANSQVSLALKLLYRARYLSLLVCGEFHPEVALIDGNIGLILFAVGEYELALKFFDKALALNISFHGELSLKVAVSHHLVSQARYCMGDFRAALQSEKETFLIYKTQLGDDHDKTKESSDLLKELTQQAVSLQKKMNDIYGGKAKSALPPLPIPTPTVATVLDLLNILNGILFVQISQQDIDSFKSDFEAKNAAAAAAKENSSSSVPAVK